MGYELISNYIRNHLYNMYELPCAPLYRMTNNTELARRAVSKNRVRNVHESLFGFVLFNFAEYAYAQSFISRI